MKLSVASDLHLEFGNLTIHNEDNTELLVLAGDVLLGSVLKKHGLSSTSSDSLAKLFYEFFSSVSNEWDYVVYVPGNHEYYGCLQNDVDSLLRENLNQFDNVFLLQNNSVVISGVLFVGSTLWTDINRGDITTSFCLKTGMNDFNKVRFKDGNNYRKFQPFDAKELHEKSLAYIKKVLAANETEKAVVVSHHAPSFLSVPERFKQEYHMNGGYASDLTNLLMYGNVNLWIHGHMHDNSDYLVGDTRVICHPRGYVTCEAIAQNYKPLTVEV